MLIEGDEKVADDVACLVCGFCQFLCICTAQMEEHLINAHQENAACRIKKLKCPGCPNIFMHEVSLSSHLTHDHLVSTMDLDVIMKSINRTMPHTQCDELTRPTLKSCHNTEVLPEKDDRICVADTGANVICPSSTDETSTIGNEKHLVCSVQGCRASFQQESTLLLHLRCHRNNTFECPICKGQKDVYSNWKLLISHMWYLHKLDVGMQSCDMCDYKCISRYKLKNIHQPIHSETKSFICTVCQNAFKNVKQLGNHMVIHKIRKQTHDTVCGMCLKTFVSKRQLKIHIERVHEQIRPYQCTFCAYKGSTKASLKMHIRRHTGEKPFNCNECSYSTSDHNSLRRHKSLHSGERPYKCPFCLYTSIQSTLYKAHLQRKHPGIEKQVIFTCKECQFNSLNEDVFVAHMLNVHKKNPNIN